MNMNDTFSTASRKQLALAATFIFLIMAVANLVIPETTRPTGRWALIFGPIWEFAGPVGLAAFWALFSIASAIRYWIYRKEK